LARQTLSGWLASTPKQLIDRSFRSDDSRASATSFWGFVATIGHVLAAEHAEREHLGGR
jgi:hypothetical protein